MSPKLDDKFLYGYKLCLLLLCIPNTLQELVDAHISANSLKYRWGKEKKERKESRKEGEAEKGERERREQRERRAVQQIIKSNVMLFCLKI